MGILFIIGVIVGVLDISGTLDVPNWINWVLLGVPATFWAFLIFLFAVAFMADRK